MRYLCEACVVTVDNTCNEDDSHRKVAIAGVRSSKISPVFERGSLPDFDRAIARQAAKFVLANVLQIPPEFQGCQYTRYAWLIDGR